LRLVQPLRIVTRKLPHVMLAGLSHFLNFILGIYVFLCGYLPLPMKQYMVKVIGKLARKHRYLVIYDQLNPAYAKYYRKAEAGALLKDAGFTDVKLYHRHGYSWAVVGTK
jgi:hypothetical protein